MTKSNDEESRLMECKPKEGEASLAYGEELKCQEPKWSRMLSLVSQPRTLPVLRA